MNSGSFFRLNLETSKVVEGITYFDYIDLPDLNKGEDIISYPIRLTISSDRVTFFIHYYDCSEEPEKPSHSEEVILDLPFTSEEKDSLSSVIKRTYNIVFPLSGYLQTLVNNRYNTLKKVNKPDVSDYIQFLEQRTDYLPFQNSKINKDSYSSLTIWGLLDDKGEHYNLWDKNEKITKLLRKLILDFMFDLMHSDVFECSKYYNEMREGLMKDFFFSAIVKKSEYYYYRRLIRNRFDRDQCESISKLQSPNALNKLKRKKRHVAKRIGYIQKVLHRKKPNRIILEKLTSKENILHCIWTIRFGLKKRLKDIKKLISTLESAKFLYAEKLDASETEWIDVIMSPMADKHFSFYPKWYEDQPSSGKEKGSDVSESWFINPEAEMERIAFPIVDKNDRFHYINSTELCDFIGSSDDSSIEKRKTKISKWFYQRYNFADTFRLHLFKGWNWLFVVTLILFSIIALTSAYWDSLLNIAFISKYKEYLQHFTFISDFWSNPRYISYFPLGVSGCLLLITIYYQIRTLCTHKKDRIDDFLVKKRRQRERRKAFRLALIWALFGSFLFFYDSIANNWKFLVLTILGLIIIYTFILRLIRPKFHTLKNIHLFMPRLVASITTAWIMLVIGNELYKERISIPIGVILSVVVLAFLLYESHKTLPNISNWNRIGRALELMLISFSMALIIGIFAIDIVSLDMLSPHCPNEPAVEIANHPWRFLSGSDACTITVIPKYLIQFSFLSMFIGVFIQMIFEEKRITDM